MTEIEILETAIGHARAGRFQQAAAVLQNSENPQTLENARNFSHLGPSSSYFLISVGISVLEHQLEMAAFDYQLKMKRTVGRTDGSHSDRAVDVESKITHTGAVANNENAISTGRSLCDASTNSSKTPSHDGMLTPPRPTPIIRCRCPNPDCKTVFSVPAEYAGGAGTCAKCKTRIRIPFTDDVAMAMLTLPPASASTDASGVGEHTEQGFVVVRLVPSQGSLLGLLADHAQKAEQRRLRPFVQCFGDWCPSCRALRGAMTDARMIDAFRGTYIIQLDSRPWQRQMDEASFGVRTIPFFCAIDRDGRPTGPRHGGEWGPDTPENMAPSLKAFFGGASIGSSHCGANSPIAGNLARELQTDCHDQLVRTHPSPGNPHMTTAVVGDTAYELLYKSSPALTDDQAQTLLDEYARLGLHYKKCTWEGCICIITKAPADQFVAFKDKLASCWQAIRDHSGYSGYLSARNNTYQPGVTSFAPVADWSDIVAFIEVHFSTSPRLGVEHQSSVTPTTTRSKRTVEQDSVNRAMPVRERVQNEEGRSAPPSLSPAMSRCLCPKCEAAFEVSADFAGGADTCPTCKTRFRIPSSQGKMAKPATTAHYERSNMRDPDILTQAWHSMMCDEDAEKVLGILRKSQRQSILSFAREYEQAFSDSDRNYAFRRRLELIMRTEFGMTRW